MNARIWKGTLAGGILYFFLGWVVYGILLADFLASNYNTCANRPMEDMVWWAMILSSFIYGLFLTLVLKWSGASTFVGGLKNGALFGLLFTSTYDFSMYSMLNMFNNFSALIIDIVVATAIAAVVGMGIVLLWGKEKAAQATSE